MDNKLKVKDLVTIGVFAVIYFVGMFVIGMMGTIPILFLIWPAVNGMTMGIVVMLFMAKVQKPWGLFIFGVIPSIIMFSMGHTFFLLVHGIIIMLVADIVRRKDNFKSFKATAIANGIFSLWTPGSLLQLFFVKEHYINMTSKMMGADYALALERLVTIPNMGLVYLGAFIGGIIGAYIGRAMLKKHFEKAGIV